MKTQVSLKPYIYRGKMTNEIIDFLILSLHQKMVNDLFDEAWNNSHIASFEVEDTEFKRFKEVKNQKR